MHTYNDKREIECIERLHQLTPTYEELLQFLLQEFLLSREELNTIHASPEIDRAKLLHAKLTVLSKERHLQLLEYEWTLLPVERIRITLVTATGHRELSAEV